SLVEGRIDLLCVGADGRVRVIDYKTDQKSPDELKAAYAAQALAYAEGVRRALADARTVEVWLYAVRLGLLIPVGSGVSRG
ncbi:MAG: PD-(D/E)XK nuclease family protein, partial [Bacillota bacterium]